jgi:hypothetical protein
MRCLCAVILVYIHRIFVVVLCICVGIVFLPVVFPSGSHFAGGRLRSG